MKLNREPVAIHFGDLQVGDCIVSPTERTVCGSKFSPGRMLEIEKNSSHLDESGQAFLKIVMGRAVDYVRRSDVIIDSSHLPKWKQVLLPSACQTRLLMRRLFEGAMSPFEERHGRQK